MRSAYAKLMPASAAAAVPTQYFCWLLNESICNFATDPKNAEQVHSLCLSFSFRVPLEMSSTRIRIPILTVLLLALHSLVTCIVLAHCVQPVVAHAERVAPCAGALQQL